MSRKQQGAASDNEFVSDGEGWFSRLRAQPGFRSAAIAFVLTVVLGLGGSAAYAYWSLRADANLIVATARPDLPFISEARCEQRSIAGIVYIEYTPPQLPSDAQILVTVTGPDNQASRHYAVDNTGSFALRALPGLDQFIGGSFGGKRISVSVTSAYLNPAPTGRPSLVEPGAIKKTAAVGQTATAVYLYSYFC